MRILRVRGDLSSACACGGGCRISIDLSCGEDAEMLQATDCIQKSTTISKRATQQFSLQFADSEEKMMKILESRAKWEAISLALACHAQRGMMAGSAVLDVVENVVRHQNLPVKVLHLLPDFRKSGLACCLDVDYPTSNERAVAITVLSDRSSHWIISSSVKMQGERGHGLASAGFEQGLDPTLSRRPW